MPGELSFLSPSLFWLLVLVPVLVLVYIWAIRRRRRFAVRYSSLWLFRDAGPTQNWLRTHLPALLILAALTSLSLALTRPVSIISLPAGQTTIVMAIDVSRSMCSRDIAPSRLEAAKTAAIDFVRHQDPHAEIGLVAFSSFAELIQPPTSDRQALEAAIESLLVGRRTAIGSGILKALDAAAEADESIAASSLGDPGAPPAMPVPKGAYAPAIIILLTDGASNVGPLPLDAAREAADRGVRVYSIGFGTANGGEFPSCGGGFVGNEPFNFGGQGFGGFGGGSGLGGGFRRGIDEETLKQIAELTGAKYYSAESASELQRAFTDLPTRTIMKHETTELTVFLVGTALLFVAAAVFFTLLWHPTA